MERTTGKIHETTLKSELFDSPFKVQYYLPKNFSELNKHHVIITFDSQDFFKYGQIEREYERLYKNDEIERAVIVGIPYPTVEWRNHYFSPNGQYHDDFVKFIGTEFLDWIDQSFPTLKVSQSRILMGESLAGSVALSVALTYPATFSKVLAFSPFVDDQFITKFESQPMLMNLNIYHTIGLKEDDFVTPMGERTNFLTPNRHLNACLEDEPLEYVYKELEGGHVWKSWKPEFKHILPYFLS